MAKTDPPIERVRTLALKLADVEEGATHGYPAFKMNGKGFAWFPKKKEVEDGSLAVRMDLAERARRVAKNPDAYYVTPHYEGYTAVLVRVWELSDAELRELLESSYAFLGAVTKRAPKKRV